MGWCGMMMRKVFRSDYFRLNPAVRMARKEIGKDRFDRMYRDMYAFLSGLHIGQFFVVSKLCHDKGNHALVLLMCDIYQNMDLNISMDYDRDNDRITLLPTLDGRKSGPYCPPDVYSKIVKSPRLWGVNPNDL